MESLLTRLCKVAHLQALEQKTLTPAERPEFYHLRMVRDGEIPVFDESKMRPDQITDVTEALARINGGYRPVNARQAVGDYMRAFGRFGIRLQDLQEALSFSKPTVLKILRELEEAGTVQIRDEKTRGKGSRRKRYFWMANRVDFGEAMVDPNGDDLHTVTDVVSKADTGIRYHGTAVQAVTCGCGACQEAFADWVVWQIGRDDRAAGQRAALDLRRRRREAEADEFKRALAIGLAARGRSELMADAD